jgi:hypothetical protein
MKKKVRYRKAEEENANITPLLVAVVFLAACSAAVGNAWSSLVIDVV